MLWNITAPGYSASGFAHASVAAAGGGTLEPISHQLGAGAGVVGLARTVLRHAGADPKFQLQRRWRPIPCNRQVLPVRVRFDLFGAGALDSDRQGRSSFDLDFECPEVHGFCRVLLWLWHFASDGVLLVPGAGLKPATVGGVSL